MKLNRLGSVSKETKGSFINVTTPDAGAPLLQCLDTQTGAQVNARQSASQPSPANRYQNCKVIG